MTRQLPIRTDFSRTFQLRFILALVAGALLTTLAVTLYLQRDLGPDYYAALIALERIEAQLTSSLVLTLCLQLGLIFLLTTGLTLLVSHRIAGPLFRCESALEQILRFDLRTEVRIRDADQLRTLVESLNRWQNGLRQLYLQAEELEEALNAEIEAAQQGRGEQDLSALESALQGLSQQLRTESPPREGEDG